MRQYKIVVLGAQCEVRKTHPALGTPHREPVLPHCLIAPLPN